MSVCHDDADDPLEKTLNFVQTMEAASTSLSNDRMITKNSNVFQSGVRPKCILHIGMPKTGSSSIQVNLYNQKSSLNCEYLKIGDDANHSPVICSVFSNFPEQYYGNISKKRTKDQIVTFNNKVKKQLIQVLSNSKAKNVVISGEDILFLSENELHCLKNFLFNYCSNIHVIAYVRPPISFMQSAFQQLVKMGVLTFGIGGFTPRYREKFEKFDRVFGCNNVSFCKFSRKSMKDGDVVIDFCERVGFEINKTEIKRFNDSLSLEATAFCYVFQKYNQSEDRPPEIIWDNDPLLKSLSAIGSTKVSFSKDLAKSVLTEISEDVVWMESRLGESLAESISNEAGGISKEEDLLAIVLANRNKLTELLTSKILHEMETPQDVANAVSVLRMNSIIQQTFTREQIERLESPRIEIDNALQELILSLKRAGQKKAAQNIFSIASNQKNPLNKPIKGYRIVSLLDHLRRWRIFWFSRVLINAARGVIKWLIGEKGNQNYRSVPGAKLPFSIDMYHDGCLKGWIFDNNDPLHKLRIEIKQGQTIIARGLANEFRQDLADASVGDGYCAFVLKVEDGLKTDCGNLLLKAVDLEQEFEIDIHSIKWV
jgi:hypothetical protein